MRIFVAICTACAVGLHFVLLQCIAWITMAFVYTQEEHSLVGGLSKTFDGAHPCALCDAVKAGLEQEKGGDHPVAPTTQKEIKLVQIFQGLPECVLPQYPSASFGRGPAWLGERRAQVSSLPERPPQAA